MPVSSKILIGLLEPVLGVGPPRGPGGGLGGGAGIRKCAAVDARLCSFLPVWPSGTASRSLGSRIYEGSTVRAATPSPRVKREDGKKASVGRTEQVLTRDDHHYYKEYGGKGPNCKATILKYI